MGVKHLMLAAIIILSQEAAAEVALAINMGKAPRDPKDLSPEQWEAKFEFLDKWGAVHGAQSQVARAYPSVPLMTLRERYGKRNSEPSRKGPPPRLDDKVEKYLVDWILYVHQAGFPVTNARLTIEVKSLAFVAGGAAARDSVGGKTWRKAFMLRHPELKRMNSSLIERCRKMGTTKESIKRYFQLADIGMTGVKACNVWFADETCIDMHPRKGVQVSPLPYRQPHFFALPSKYLSCNPYHTLFLGLGRIFSKKGLPLRARGHKPHHFYGLLQCHWCPWCPPSHLPGHPPLFQVH